MVFLKTVADNCLSQKSLMTAKKEICNAIRIENALLVQFLFYTKMNEMNLALLNE